MTALIDLTGKRFGKLLVIKRAKNKNSAIRWDVLCDCGTTKVAHGSHLKSGATKSCGCRAEGEHHPNWQGYGEISADKWYTIKHRYKYRKSRNFKGFDITIEYVWKLFLKQNRKCALSGLPLYFGKGYRGKSTASLDRIDSTKGYLKNNVQWVHAEVNRMKNIFTDERFIEICKSVAQYRKTRLRLSKGKS